VSHPSTFVSSLRRPVSGHTRPSSRGALLGLVLTAVVGWTGPGCTATASHLPSSATAGVPAPDDAPARAAVLYSADGRPASLEDLVAAASEVDVVFVGERHGDMAVHSLQFALLEALLEEGKHPGRQIILSLEMFETDVQLVLDEYLADLISEDHFLAAARPWPNYQRDYRPLVELAGHTGIRVVAANVPRRYVNRVSRLGRQALHDLSEASLTHLPPLPYVGPSEAYRSEWNERMTAMAEAHGGIAVGATTHGAHGSTGDAAGRGPPEREDPALEAQALWDASMAYSIHRALECPREVGSREADGEGSGCAEGARPLVMHLTGSFHVENRTGTPEALRHFRPNVRDLVITVRAVGNPADFSEAFGEGGAGSLADFILLTPLPSAGGHP
jgi:uncharacterized iron-regulated protein